MDGGNAAKRMALPSIKKIAQVLLAFLILSAIFAIAYSQEPLYTSNQDQYFLHGMAQAGVGDLRTDWLARTTDPTPVFSALVRLTLSIFHAEWLFYVEYALLMGVYVISLLAILATIFPLGSDWRRWIIAFAVLVILHSAAIRLGLTLMLGSDWTYLLEDGLAGQRALGLVFQPSVFAVFLLLSVALFLRGRHWGAALAAAAAATVHPTYLLGAAALIAAYMTALWWQDKNLRRALLLGVIALAAVAPILVYTYSNFLNTNRDIAHQARDILVYTRIPHHTIVSVWFGWPDALKILAIIAAIWMTRRTRLFPVLWIPAAIGAALSGVQMATGSVLLALLFPWRISVYLFPLALSVMVAMALSWLWKQMSSQATRRLVVVALLGISLAVAAGIARYGIEQKQKEAQPESAFMHFVATHPQPGELYMIPLKMQDFRLATGAAIFVDKESIPYQDTDVLEWNRRLNLASSFYNNLGCSAITDVHQTEGITRLVVEQDNNSQIKTCSNLEQLYADKMYVLYAIR